MFWTVSVGALNHEVTQPGTGLSIPRTQDLGRLTSVPTADCAGTEQGQGTPVTDYWGLRVQPGLAAYLLCDLGEVS